jgi:hypothetical protein
VGNRSERGCQCGFRAADEAVSAPTRVPDGNRPKIHTRWGGNARPFLRPSATPIPFAFNRSGNVSFHFGRSVKSLNVPRRPRADPHIMVGASAVTSRLRPNRQSRGRTGYDRSPRACMRTPSIEPKQKRFVPSWQGAISPRIDMRICPARPMLTPPALLEIRCISN